jgi:hypothetical protein
MNMISKDIFFRLMKISNIDSLKDLSESLGYKQNWATSTRKRNTIPYEACALIAEKHECSMDYLLYGIENSNKVDINELKLSVTEGVFAAIQADMIVLNKDVKISHVTETITSEIKEACNINDENQKLNKAQ